MLIGALDDLKSMTQDEVLTFLSEDYVHFCESSDPWKMLNVLKVFLTTLN